ncbi:MAG: aminotransferase class V-fold PLP-dependent enzyme, partial [Spirochaeta sp.]|nr:aminotransferase class V-fold PLP-dependent enzyme [Spirochaeta sp.]
MTETLNVQSLRDEFPALKEPMRGHDLIYFDNGATSLKPHRVIGAVTEYYREYSANIHRGVYEMSGRATAAYDDARTTVKRLLHVPDGEGEVIFTRGTTESINMVAVGWGGRHLTAGDEIVLSPMEHHSNMVPWQQIAQRTGAKVSYFPLTDDGSFTEDAV